MRSVSRVMRRQFWKACLVVLAGYTAILLMGFWYALFAIPALQAVWGAFCVVRLTQLFRGGAHRAGAPEWDRESFGFALGGLVSSCSFLLLLALTPIRVLTG